MYPETSQSKKYNSKYNELNRLKGTFFRAMSDEAKLTRASTSCGKKKLAQEVQRLPGFIYVQKRGLEVWEESHAEIVSTEA
jgi:hypothetical protein